MKHTSCLFQNKTKQRKRKVIKSEAKIVPSLTRPPRLLDTVSNFEPLWKGIEQLPRFIADLIIPMLSPLFVTKRFIVFVNENDKGQANQYMYCLCCSLRIDNITLKLYRN